VCWSTAATPTTADSVTTNGSGTGSFTGSLTGLSPNTTYYVRAYATNTAGTAYGSKVIFSTSGGLPSVSTTAVTGITGATADSGGKVTDDGGDSVTARGVCWSTSTRPTTGDNHTVDGKGSGRFISYLTGLTPDTTYNYRAYATNTFGTAYGREKTFTTESQPEPPTVEIIEPQDGANVSGVATIKAKAESKQGIKKVEFFVDGDKIGAGTLEQKNRSTLMFDLTGADTLFIDSDNQLQKKDGSGNTAAVMNVNIETTYIQAGPDGSIYVNFKSPWLAADGNRYVFVKVYSEDGSCIGIDPEMFKLFTGFKTGPALQFDETGNLYYIAAQRDGKLCLKKYAGRSATTSILFNEDTKIDEWFINPDGTAILAGRTISTGNRWLKNKAPGEALNHLTDIFSDIRRIAHSADGCSYAGTDAAAYRISGSQAVEIDPTLLPPDKMNQKRSAKTAAPGKEITLEFLEIHTAGNTYSIDWDASLYDYGLHAITAAAYDNGDLQAEDSISVNIPEIILTLSALRETERAWIISRLYGKLEISAVNLSEVPVAKYVIYRKVAAEGLNTLNTNTEGEFKAIATFTGADLENGFYTYDDKYLDQDKTYTYKVAAQDAAGAVIAVSQEVSI
jgi:hypothetical protein